MSVKQEFKLKCMYWYNIIVAGGFALIITLLFFLPELRDLLKWYGSDPIIVGLISPFYLVLAVFSVLFLKSPSSGIVLLKIQIFYKPITILFLIYFTLTGEVHIGWSTIIITGLLLYIFGNIWAVYGNKAEDDKNNI